MSGYGQGRLNTSGPRSRDPGDRCDLLADTAHLRAGWARARGLEARAARWEAWVRRLDREAVDLVRDERLRAEYVSRARWALLQRERGGA